MESTTRSQAVRTLEQGPLNQPITAHFVPERFNKQIYQRLYKLPKAGAFSLRISLGLL